MSKSIRLALVQLGHTSSDKAVNLARAQRLVIEAAARKPKPDVILLPECFNSPYGVDYFEQYAEQILEPDETLNLETTRSASVQLLSKLAKDLSIYLVGGSIPERDPNSNKLYNTSTVYDRSGHVIATHRKLHLFDIDIPGGITFQESKTLTAGNKVTVFDTEFGKFGLGICYDLRFPEMAAIAARKGAIAMLYPGAFNTTTGPLHWELLQRGRAVDNQIYVVSCSPARPEGGAGYPAYGFSMVVDPSGKVVASAQEEETIVEATLELDAIATARRNIPISTQRRFDVYANVATASPGGA